MTLEYYIQSDPIIRMFLREYKPQNSFQIEMQFACLRMALFEWIDHM